MTKKILSSNRLRKAVNRIVIITGFLSVCFFKTSAVIHSIQDLDTPISLKVTNMPVKNVLKQINKAIKLSFVFSNEIVTDQTVTIDVKNEKLSLVLSKIFDPLGMEYQLSGNMILIEKKQTSAIQVIQKNLAQ